MSRPAITMRRALHTDVPRLVEMNHAAYPDLVQEGVVWNASQLHAHLERFPGGQMVACADGVIAGAISTLVLPAAFGALVPHTWMEATGGGLFATHDPGGSTLYLADVYVDPAFQGRGIGSALYTGLRALCVSLRLGSVVAGGRLWGYAEVADRMTVQSYVAKVLSGEMFDRVLVSQLRAGFVVRDVIPGYLDDPKSMNWATLLEWQNPSVRRAADSAVSPAAPPRSARADAGVSWTGPANV
ncbi:MAG: GNAT family N-acetyltransferase [Deltaproteobacteria bacterium]